MCHVSSRSHSGSHKRSRRHAICWGVAALVARFHQMPGTPQAHYRIAVIEANELVRELLLCWLRDEGHEVSDFEEASLLSEGDDFDVVFADVSSPRNSAEPVRLLRSVHEGSIVLVSARLRGSIGRSCELARQLGVAALLPKPFTRQELIAVVDEAMRSS